MFIDKLVEISQEISPKNVIEEEFIKFIDIYGVIDRSYVNLMLKRNGLICFESALQIYPFDKSNMSLKNINNDEIRGKKYLFINYSYFCFAQDLFGFQFCFTHQGIEIFNTETGEFSFLTDTFENWIQMILNDYNYLTGYEIGHEWQKKFRKLQLSERLNGKIPFVLGGSYSIENLYPINLISLLDFRADIANQIYNLEDGQQIILKNI